MRVSWAPWRMTYLESGGPAPGCVFCVDDSGRSEDLLLAADPSVVVLLNKFPYNNGHLLVAPRRHASRLGDLERVGYEALMRALLASTGIVEKALSPDGMNVGINIGAAAGAGIAAHLHWHIVPRWDGDTNYMPVLAEVKVLPQHLEESARRLRPLFDQWMAAHGGEF